MQSKELLKMALQSSQGLVLPLLENMRDAAFTFPTPKGGNHPMWILGHLTFGEGMLFWDFMRGVTNPLSAWKECFDGGTEPVADPSRYPSFDDVLSRFHDLRAQSLQLLDSLTEADLDQPSKNIPAGFEPFFGTYRQCFLTTALHWMNHRGQVADCRRAAGRKPIMA